MNTAVINVRVNPVLKVKAQALAQDLGLSLSSLINAYLKHLVKTRKVVLTASEEPTDYLLKIIKKSKEEIKKGKVSPGFNKAEEAIKWLNSPKKKYEGKI